MKNILLISPASRAEEAQKLMESILDIWDMENIRKKALMVPLHIATIAALTPDHIGVDLWDELMHGWIDEKTGFDKEYDLIGITSFSWNLGRAKEIARVFRERSIPVAVGGPGVSAAHEGCRDDFDILFIGEAELTWPRFIADFAAGNYRKEYKQNTLPDIVRSPPPRWDSIAHQVKNYVMGSVRPGRGCPFNCDFCNVPKIFGQKIRHKPIENVLEEVAALERLGIDRILFCSDHFIGNPGYTKELLRKLISLNNSLAKPLSFHAEVTLAAAHDEEMLSLLADANFGNLLIGLSMEGAGGEDMLQNRHGDVVEDCKKVMSYGLTITGSIKVGFDQDTPESFIKQFEFFQEAFIPYPRTDLLKANQGTDLWKRLLEERRLLDPEKLCDAELFPGCLNPRVATNIIPKSMSRVELYSGYLRLLELVYDWDNFESRLKRFISNVKRKPNVPSNNSYHGGPPPAFRDFLLSLDEKAQQAISNIFSHTHQYAPFMMPKVVIMIIRQYMEASNLPTLRRTILEQIRFEESRDIEKFLYKAG